MDGLLLLLFMIIGIAIRAGKSKNQKAPGAQRRASVNKQRQPAAKRTNKAQTPVVQPTVQTKAQTSFAQEDEFWEGRDGSIEMPPVEPHEHEGKPMPCPAEEREAPRPRPSRQAPAVQTAHQTGLQLDFAGNAVVKSVVMAEILKRSEFKNGRRVIR